MGFTNKDQFNRQLVHWLDGVENMAEESVRRMARHALELAISYSPYDTGQFIASWRINSGGDAHDAGKGQRPSRGEAAGEAEAASGAYIVSYKLGQSLALTNGAPHATFVEHGSWNMPARYIIRRVAANVSIGPMFFNFADEGIVEGDLGP